MAVLIDAINVKKRTLFEAENVPFVCLDAEVSTPTARGGQTLVRIKMRNMLTQAVFDRTFKAGEKFKEPDLAFVWATYLYADAAGYNFMDQRTFDTITLVPTIVGDDKFLLVDNLEIQIHTYNDKPIGLVFPPHVEITVASCEEGARGDTASGSVTKVAKLETGMEIRVPLFIKEGEKIKVHTESREFSGRA